MSNLDLVVNLGKRAFGILSLTMFISIGYGIEYRSSQAGQVDNSSSDRPAFNLRGEEIKIVQAQLNQKGFEVGPPDGVMGQRTVQAIRQFQREINQPVTGRLDPVTLAQLGVPMRDHAESETGSQKIGMPDTPTRDESMESS